MKDRNRRTVDVSLPSGLGDSFLDDFRALLTKLSVQRPGFKTSYLIDTVFSKYLDPGKVTPKERTTAAIVKWLSAETSNRETNVRLLIAPCDEEQSYNLVPENKQGDAFPDFRDGILLRNIRRTIARILGPLDYPSVLDNAWHTNGASTRVRRSPAASIEKLSGTVEITSSALKLWFAAFSGSVLSAQELAIQESSSLFTVPKKTEIDRVACKEPEGNMLLQRSVGIHIRRRLRAWGINLQDQTVNQRMARDAVALNLATVDLSSASDTISRQLVINLLPFDWWSLLDDLRVKSTYIPQLGVLHELEMFSSMGNGFTFELESLLFYAIAREIVLWLGFSPSMVSVYGDDIILPSACVPMLDDVFSWFGFSMNPDKTHASGPFRESCGRHYYNGLDVTPFFIRKAVDTLPEVINVLNSLLSWDSDGEDFFTTEEVFLFWQHWSTKLVPPFLWGGISVSDPTCLVTGHSPRKRLVPITKQIEHPRDLALISWLGQCRHNGNREVTVVDPRLAVRWKAQRVVSCGEHTRYRPGLAFCLKD